MKASLVLSRFGQAIVVLIGVSLLVFVIVRVIPGDPVRLMAGEQASEERIQAIRTNLGLDLPLWQQYMIYLNNALHGDFGWSLRYQRPTSELIAGAFPATAKLALVSIGLAIFVGIPVGIISAVKCNTAIDSFVMMLMLIGQAMPTFWWGLVLIVLFSVTLRILPTSGDATAKHFVLPALTLATYITALIVRLTRSTMIEVLDEDYVRVARAKGLRESHVVVGHALKNAALPIATVIGLQFANLLGGAVITETVFGWPGLGTLAVNAIYNRDYPLVQAIVLLMAVLFVVINTVVDISYLYLDPRLNEK